MNSSHFTLEQTVEAILFVTSEPISVKQLAQATTGSTPDILAALQALAKSLEGRGICLQYHDKKYSLVSSPDASRAIERHLGSQARTELSKPALETLAIIAYKQPATRHDIETIRGVSCEQTLRNLLTRGLISEDPNPEVSTRARRYVTSSKFLQHFGFTHSDQLPSLDQLNNSKSTSTES